MSGKTQAVAFPCAAVSRPGPTIRSRKRQRFIVVFAGVLVLSISGTLCFFVLFDRLPRSTPEASRELNLQGILVGRWYHAIPHNFLVVTFAPGGSCTFDEVLGTYTTHGRTVTLRCAEISATGFVDGKGRLVVRAGIGEATSPLTFYKERVITQGDGSTLRVVENDVGGFVVVVETAQGVESELFECASRESLERLADKHGWELSPKDPARP